MTLQVGLCLIAWCIGCTSINIGEQAIHCRLVTLHPVITFCAVSAEEICKVLIDLYPPWCPKLIYTL